MRWVAGDTADLAPRAVLESPASASRIFGAIQASRIGVGMAAIGHPSLRTGRADFPHPALQSVSHPLVAGLVRSTRAKAYREISPSFSKKALG